MRPSRIGFLSSIACMLATLCVQAEIVTWDLGYEYPVEVLKLGHSLGNRNAYITLDGNSDLVNEPARFFPAFRKQ
jgi:hypothetical protein